MEGDLNREKIKLRITELRKKNKWTQLELSKRTGVTPAAISQIEKGDRIPTIPVLHRLAKVLEVSLDFLMGRKDSSDLDDLLQNNEVLEFYRGFQRLSPEDRKIIEQQIEFLKSKK